MPRAKFKKVFVFGKDYVNWATSESKRNNLKILRKINNIILTNDRKKTIYTRLVHHSSLLFLFRRFFCSYYDPLMLDADVFYCIVFEYLVKNTLNSRLFYRFLQLLKKIRKTKIIAVITNDIRYTPEKIQKGKKLIDYWIASNSKVCSYLNNLGLNAEIIPFLINKNIFKKLNDSKLELIRKLGINFNHLDKYFLIGSFQRDTLNDLKTPKWQKDPDLLIEILNQLPKNKYIFVVAGPRRHYLINQLKQNNIPYVFAGDENYITENRDDIFINNLPLEKVNLLYNLIDLYIVSSKSEGGPKAILECSLTKTLIISTDAGLASDNIHPTLIYEKNDLNPIIEKIRNLIINPNQIQDLIEYNYNKVIDNLDEEKIIKKIKRIISKIV